MSALVNTDAEQSVIACLLVDNAAIADVQELVTPEDFTSATYRRAYEAIGRLVAQGAAADPIVLGPLVTDDDHARGAIEHLTGLMETIPTTATIRTHATAVAIAGRLRRLVATCSDIIGEAKDASLATADEARKFFADIHAKIGETASFGVRKHITAEQAVKQALAVVEERAKTKGQLPGITTGFARLDELLLGLRRKHLVIAAAKTGVGKTAIALNLAANAAKAGARVFVCSYEMGVDELTMRMLASESRVGGMRLEMGALEPQDWAKLERGVANMRPLPIVFADVPPPTIPALRIECQALKRRGGLDVVIVDYLQLMDSAGTGKNREQQVSEVSRGLKRIAMELGVCVVALSQLNRATDRHEEPKLSDLRDSGAIEQDANSVLMLWAESDDAPLVNFKVAKNRGAPIGNGTLTFHRTIQRFTDAQL
jgi:replicative DNA helicase